MAYIRVSKILCFYLLLAISSSFGNESKGTTVNPQMMWNPGKDSILGENVVTASFEKLSITNKTVQIGSSSFLNCKVRNPADKKVTWIRHRDNHVLTAGLYSYSKDNRFGIIRKEGSDDWILHIRFTQKRDEGRYECQIATKGGGYGHVVNLFVVVPEAIISGAPELHVQSGSTINLVCLVKDSITPPNFLFWFHNSEMINYDQSRGGISVLTDLENKEPTSKLSITDATFNDSGNYTCVTSNTKPASINVFVSEGDKTAAIQRLDSGSPKTGSEPQSVKTTMILALVLSLQFIDCRIIVIT